MTAANDITIGFVGAGKMAQAIGRGISGKPSLLASPAAFIDPDDGAARVFESLHPGAVRRTSFATLAANCNVVLLAVKPQIMGSVLGELNSHIDQDHLVISIVAGISLDLLEHSLASSRLVRVMPNTPCLIGEGISAISWSPKVAESDRQFVRELFAVTGRTIEVPEYQLDAVTGLSGSGPAYVFTFVEALVDGGVLAGLPRDVALELATQTVRGSVDLIRATGKSPADLRGQVTSPGGTTIAGLAVLERMGFRGAVMESVAAAARRAAGLGESGSGTG